MENLAHYPYIYATGELPPRNRPKHRHNTRHGCTNKKARLTDLMACPPGLTADATVFAIGSQSGVESPHCEETRYCLQGLP